MQSKHFHQTVGAIIIFFGMFIWAWMDLFAPTQAEESDTPHIRLKAQFRSIEGIVMGTPVVMAGIEIGKVLRHALDPKTLMVNVELSVDETIAIPYDSALMVLSDGFAGRKYLRVFPGGEMDMMVEGDSFDYVQNAVIFEEMLEKIISAAEQKKIKPNG